ncbi:MAG: 2-C-methyl-D-erythritol 2,4-cyclodiphosphate synthase [Candidatus Omnitrophica bacterium]|nr:2-C-methyl-D-erythritol 2,4-cyclodiphosphate synthase [Candidatus Omnitrophota bacterium]
MRVGIGYDVHRLAARSNGARRTRLKLGGVAIAHSQRLLGHSDADVLLHAIADALLGAIGAPDLGELFPSSDPRYKGMDSRRFVARAEGLVRRSGWRVSNLDATVVADAPKLGPHKARMRQAISTLLRVSPQAVSVKAKTTEGLSPGKEGIAAQAVVLLVPDGNGRLSRRRTGTRRSRRKAA